MLNLACTLVNFRNPSIPVMPLRRHVAHVSHPTQHLYRLMSAHRSRLARRQLCHGRLPREPLPVVLQLGRSPRQQPRSVPRDDHLTDLVLDGLHLGNGLAEGVSFERVLHGAVDGGGGDAEGLAGDSDASSVERLHGDFEALAGLADEVRFGDADVVHDQVGGGGGADSEFVFLGAEGEARGVHWYDKGGDALVFQRFIRSSKHNRSTRLMRIRNPSFRTIHNPFVSVLRRRNARSTGIAPIPRFAQSKTSNIQFAILVAFVSRVRCNVLFFQFIRTEGVDGVEVQTVVRRHDDAHGGAAATDLFHGDGVGEGIQFGSVVVGGDVDSHHAQFCQIIHSLGRKFVFLIPFSGMWHQLFLGKFTTHFVYHLMFRWQLRMCRVLSAVFASAVIVVVVDGIVDDIVAGFGIGWK
mmetsp:Transcript_27981/g.58342  ORF Transcript_27981/g.58342 Transcript_27981/m.58342 type:complete len:410 (-) Transcript_27981:437-1666(-)